MAVDPRKQRVVLVVHGVQLGDSHDLRQHLAVAALLEGRLGNMPLPFQADLFRYEHLNDQAQRLYQQLVSRIVTNPVGSVLASSAIDLVGDVVTARLDTSTAAQIRRGLRDRILEIFAAGHPCYVVAHSLGSIYALDVLNALMEEAEYFHRDSRRSWPVQGLITLGSPIGLGLFRHDRPRLTPLGSGNKWFRWLNYYDRTDPVVSGRLFGQQLTGFEIAETYREASPEQGWVIRDHPVDTGKTWLMAHVGYWEHPVVGDGLFTLVTN